MTEWYEPTPGAKLGIDEEVDSRIGADISADVAAALPALVTAAVASAVATAEAAETAADLAAKVVFDNGNSGAAKAITRASGAWQKITLTASAPTLTISGFTAGSFAEITLYLIQDGTGSRLLPTFSPVARYGSAGAPTLSTAAASVDVVKLFSIDGGTTLDVVLVEKGA